MGIVRIFSAVLAVSVLLTAGLMAGGFENSGVGIKARGMGGAFRAIADDWTAAYYNPAGYAYQLDNQLGANLALVHHRDEIVPDYRWNEVYETGMFNDQINYNAHEILSNPATGFVVRMPVWGETVFGLSAYQPFDRNVTWELFQMLPAYNKKVGLPGDQYRVNLDVVAFQLTAAREFVEDKLSIGVGVQLLRADLVYNNIFFRDNPLAQITLMDGIDSLAHVFEEDTTWQVDTTWSDVPDPEYDIFRDRPYRRHPQWSNNNGNGYGFGLRAGMLWKVSENADVAATVAVPFSIKITGEAENRFYMPNRPTIWQTMSDGYQGTVKHLFLAGQTIIHRASFETTLDLPPSVGLGLALRATEKLTIAVDAEYTLWSSYEGLEFKYSDHEVPRGPADSSAIVKEFLTADLSAPVEWDNAAKFMLGAMYGYADYLTLLGGVSFDQSPARNTDQATTPQFMDSGNQLGLNFGFIAHIDRWDVGLVTSYLSQPDLSVEGFIGSEIGGAVETFPGDYSASTYETILSFNYRF